MKTFFFFSGANPAVEMVFAGGGTGGGGSLHGFLDLLPHLLGQGSAGWEEKLLVGFVLVSGGLTAVFFLGVVWVGW